MRTRSRCASRRSASAPRSSVLTSTKMNFAAIPPCWASCPSGTETEDIKVPPWRTQANNSGCVLHEMWIESGALNTVGREPSSRSVCRLSQLCVVVCNEDRKKARRLRVTRICTNQVSAAGGLKEGLAGAIDPHWPSR
jgi:hypothetical protein